MVEKIALFSFYYSSDFLFELEHNSLDVFEFYTENCLIAQKRISLNSRFYINNQKSFELSYAMDRPYIKPEDVYYYEFRK